MGHEKATSKCESLVYTRRGLAVGDEKDTDIGD